MKISLKKHEIVGLSAFLLVALVAITLGWLGVGGLTDKTSSLEQLNERKGKSEVADILGRPGGLGEVKKEIGQMDEIARALAKKEDELLGPWREASDEAIGTGKDWSHDVNKWKDQLVRYNDEILKKSAKNNKTKSVGLAPNFYLGLESFKQKSPREDQLADLSLQLSVSKRLVDLLFQAKETAAEGYPTSCTVLNLQGPLSDLVEAPSEGNMKGKTGDKKLGTRSRFTMEFESSPEVLYTFMDGLSTDRFFFIPGNLIVANVKEGFPKRSELATQFASPKVESAASPEGALRGDGTKTKLPLLKILAGDEKVLVKIQIDFVQFGPGGEGKSTTQGKKQ